MVSRQQNQIHQIFQQDRSENITVTWRRFARSSGLALGALDVGTVVLKGGFVNPPRRRAGQSKGLVSMFMLPAYDPTADRCPALPVLARGLIIPAMRP
jgi:hypothetical protein